ncbi:hypothetical protein TELCIR_06276 [Teladorsagia circumcincta]|uniref:Sodium:neurotransmitter symporter family protein n=1 Tax=Teladorsagia circumcincta TaxID=45464 RepID=A0A2G9UNN1_TELCI|nr:hypothetical protein TELCIR_06276 [Teladorsagia circumcincta]
MKTEFTTLEEEEESDQSEPINVVLTKEHHEYEIKTAVSKLSRICVRQPIRWQKLGYYCVVISYLATFDSFTIFSLNVKTYGVYWLILYIACMGLIGFPLLYLEAALGQYVHASALIIFDRIAPICVGIGVSSTITVFLCCLIDHHRLIMMFLATLDSINFFADKLPWVECLHMENREACTSLKRKCSTLLGAVGDDGEELEPISYASDFNTIQNVYSSIGDTCFRTKMKAMHMRYNEKTDWLLSLPVVDYL